MSAPHNLSQEEPAKTASDPEVSFGTPVAAVTFRIHNAAPMTDGDGIRFFPTCVEIRAVFDTAAVTLTSVTVSGPVRNDTGRESPNRSAAVEYAAPGDFPAMPRWLADATRLVAARLNRGAL